MTKTRRIKHKGGAVSHLEPALFRYESPQSMVDDITMYSVSAHGETTPDKKFLIVPPQTYIFFTSHSGDSAYSGIEGSKQYILYGPTETKEQYYEKLYKQLFTPYAGRKAAGVPLLKEDLYIYEPGDVIPDYNLFFLNTSDFIFMHGIYNLPIRSISGPEAQRHSDHWGKTKYVMRTLLDNGTLTPDMLDTLDPRDREDILTTPLETLKKGTVKYDGVKIATSAAFQKIEELCCYTNPDNLLFKPPINQKLRKKQSNILRLSYVLNTMPLEDGKGRRFFFMDFCRVSFDEYLTELKTLLRSVSFSGKCGSMKERGPGFNIFRVTTAFCNLPSVIKDELFKTTEGLAFLNTLVKVVKKPPRLESWNKCVPPNVITSSYIGAMDMEDIENITIVSMIVSRMITEYTRKIAYLKTRARNATNQTEKQGAEKELKKLIGIHSSLRAFYEPIKIFHSLYSRKRTETFDEQRIRNRLMNSIYEKIIEKLGIRFSFEDEPDPLYFRTTPIVFLEDFEESLQTPKYDKEFEEIKAELSAMNDYENHDILLLLTSKFSIFMGNPPISRGINLPFDPAPESNNNLNAKLVQDEENLGLGGGRRKTRKSKRRLVSKK